MAAAVTTVATRAGDRFGYYCGVFRPSRWLPVGYGDGR